MFGCNYMLRRRSHARGLDRAMISSSAVTKRPRMPLRSKTRLSIFPASTLAAQRFLIQLDEGYVGPVELVLEMMVATYQLSGSTMV